MSRNDILLEFAKAAGHEQAVIASSRLYLSSGSREYISVEDDADIMEYLIQPYLEKKFWLQVNCDSSTGWKFRAIVGIQNVMHAGRPGLIRVVDEGETLLDTVLMACIKAAELRKGVAA